MFKLTIPPNNYKQLQLKPNIFRSERRLVLTGDVYVLQGENSIRAEKVTYLLEEGKFIAKPKEKQQVMSTYMIPQPNNSASSQPDVNVPAGE